MTAPSPRGPARRATASTIAVAAVVVGLVVGAAACAKEKLSPAEARRARVEKRLGETFSNRQVDCILDRVDTPVLVALDSGRALNAGTEAMFTYSNAVTICVTDPDAPRGAATSIASTTSTTSAEDTTTSTTSDSPATSASSTTAAGTDTSTTAAPDTSGTSGG